MGKFKFTWDKNRNWGAIRRDNTYYNKYGFDYEIRRLAANVIKRAYDNYTHNKRQRSPLLNLPWKEFNERVK